MASPGHPSRKLLTRKEAAAYLTATYFKITARTLAVYVTDGYGPPYRLLGGAAHYSRKDLDDWVDDPARDGLVRPTRLAGGSGALSRG